MSSPASITVPARITLGHIHAGQHVTASFQVANTGRAVLQVTSSDGAYTKLAEQHPALSWVTGLTPVSFTLQPGKSQTVTITLSIPPGARGDHAVQAVFRATPAGDPTGNVSITGAVASTVLVSLPGHDPAVTGTPLVTGPPPASFPVVPVAAGGSGLLVAACAAAVVLRRMARKSTAARATARPRHARG